MTGRILVTGATGFLGGAVLRRLGENGIGQGRDPARCQALGAEGLRVLRWSLPGEPPPGAALDGVDTIIHCAGLSAPFGPRAAFEHANVAGTRSLLAFARAHGVTRFVFVSSPSVYFALSDQLGVREDAVLPPPFTAYAHSKIEAERLVRAAPDVGPVILRPRGIYGPGDTALLPRLLAAARVRALPRFRGGRARIDLTYVDDVVDATLAAAAANPDVTGRTFNISGGEVLSVCDIVERACARAGIIPRWRDLPLTPALMAARLAETFALLTRDKKEPVVTRYGLGLFAFEQSLDISRARLELGWTPKHSFEQGLAMTFDPKGAL